MRLASIAIPAHNARETLPMAIRSVFAQTHQNFELLLIDDGSTDGTLDLITGISDARVRVFADGKNMGLAHRLNEAASASRGEFLFRMDADDVMHPERLEKQISFLLENTEVDLVGSAVATIDENDRVTGTRGHGPVRRTAAEIFKRGLFIHPTVAGRRSWFLDNLYNPEYRRSQDFELWCRTAGSLQAAVIPEQLLFYRDGYSSPASYSVNARNARRIIWKYGRQKVGLSLTLQLIATRWIKQQAHSLAAAINARDPIIRRRASRASAELTNELERVLEIVAVTSVPGLASIE